ncbi:MAG: hypothetical protein L3J32_12500, partial [Rhizobiaceae bacterium]|nr:hypothetical protein [Rhizobiaceae bacterium]
MTEQSSHNPQYSPIELLHWYKHAGVDLALEDAPVDRFAEFKKQMDVRKDNTARTRPRLTTPLKSTPAQSPMSDAAIPDENVVADTRKKA